MTCELRNARGSEGKPACRLCKSFLTCACNSFGSYQAPRYHINTMLRARYLVSSLALTLSMITFRRSDAVRASLAICRRVANVVGRFSLSQTKYSCLTLTGSEPG